MAEVSLAHSQETCPEAGRQRWRKNNRGHFCLSHVASLTQNASDSPGAVTRGWLIGVNGSHGGEDFRLTEGETVVGSGWDADVVFTSPNVSRAHASIILTSTAAKVRDLDSASGVLVNGAKVLESDLRSGDVLRLGASDFCFFVAENCIAFETPVITDNTSAISAERAVSMLGKPQVWGWLLGVKGGYVGQDFRVIIGENHLGSDFGNEISISVKGAEGVVCVLSCDQSKCVLRRKTSSLPVLVNRGVVDSRVLKEGDVIAIGADEFRVRIYE
jgi:pSer/pThr/pTyr-binding forkhead associated (FHA) protein